MITDEYRSYEVELNLAEAALRAGEVVNAAVHARRALLKKSSGMRAKALLAECRLDASRVTPTPEDVREAMELLRHVAEYDPVAKADLAIATFMSPPGPGRYQDWIDDLADALMQWAYLSSQITLPRRGKEAWLRRLEFLRNLSGDYAVKVYGEVTVFVEEHAANWAVAPSVPSG